MKSIVVSVAALSLIAAFSLLTTGPHQAATKKPTSQQKETEAATPAAQVTQETVQKTKASDRSTTEDEIAAYLEGLLSKDFPLSDHYQAHLEAEARIRKALSEKIEIDFDNMPLTKVVQFFREELDVNIQLDVKVLEEVPIDTSELVTAHADVITGRSALEFVLRNLTEPLTWIVQHEMLLITTLEEADAQMQIKFYDVTDLVVVRGENNELSLDYDQLKDAIRSGCDEVTLWLDEDGEGGTIEAFDAVGIHGLAIRQTRQTHDEIEVILAGLRRLRRKEPAIFRKIKHIAPKEPPQEGGGIG